MADLLTVGPELTVIGEAASYSQALARIPALKPDVAVLDVRLPDGNGIELCRERLSRMPGLHCLMLTSYTDDQAMLDAILAGASGYVVKDIRRVELTEAVHEVGAGKSLLDSRAAAALNGEAPLGRTRGRRPFRGAHRPATDTPCSCPLLIVRNYARRHTRLLL